MPKQDSNFIYNRFMHDVNELSLQQSFLSSSQYDDGEWNEGKKELEDLVSEADSYTRKANEVIQASDKGTDTYLAAKAVKGYAKILKTFASEKLKIKDWNVHTEELTFVATYQKKCSRFFRVSEVENIRKVAKKI